MRRADTLTRSFLSRMDEAGTAVLPVEDGLRRLRGIALGLPTSCLLAVLAIRHLFVARIAPDHGHLFLDVALVLGTMAFSIVMFALVDRSYRTLVRENRDLAAVDAVVVAARHAYTPESVADACLDAVLEVTGASRARIVATQPADPTHSPDVWSRSAADVAIPGREETVPLMSGPESVGSLTLTGVDLESGPLTSSALHGIGRAVGSALQRARYLAHLQDECRDATLAERDRIAREMHDSLAQALGAAHLRLTALTSHPDLDDAGELRHELDDVAELCRDAYADVREAILGLRESGRTDRTLLESLRSYLATFSRRTGIDTRLRTELDELTLPPHHEIQVIRIVQEALTNVRKHADATTAVVRVDSEGDVVVVAVEDDGCGFDPARVSEDRYGLATMSERTRLLDGWLTVDSTPGHGTRITLGVPAGRGTRSLTTASA